MTHVHKNSRHDVASMFEDASTVPRELVHDYPVPTAVVVFGLGIGVGLLAVHLLGGPGHKAEPKSSTFETLGRQICDAVRNAVPEAISRHMPC